MLEARNVALRVLKEISLTLHPGEVLAILGPNGAGKSTLLKLLTGEWTPHSGSVYLEDRPLTSWHSNARARCLAVLPQTSQLAARFTGMEVAMLGRLPHGNGPKDRQIAAQALDAVEAGHLASRFYPELSGGEQQRIQLARVLCQIWTAPVSNSRYLILDEPTANLDLAQQHRTLRTARTMAREGVAVVAVMHDMNLASQYADRVMLLKDGAALALGPPHRVFTPEAIHRAFCTEVGVIPHPTMSVPLIFAI